MDLKRRGNIQLSEQNEYETMLILVAISIPSFIKCLKFYFPHNPISKWFVTTASQYTNWNITLILINYFHNNRLMNVFITINSSTIFIVYHIFYCTNNKLIRKIPNIPSFCNDFHINIANVFMHVIPFILYTYDCYKTIKARTAVDLMNYNMGYNVILFNMIWALQCFQGFDPHTVYFKVPYKDVYNIWVFIIFLNITIGFCLQNVTVLFSIE